MLYRIQNTNTAQVLGFYTGATAAEALDAMARDAGYMSHADACAIIETDGRDLAVVTVDVAIAEAAAYTAQCFVDCYRAECPAEKWIKGAWKTDTSDDALTGLGADHWPTYLAAVRREVARIQGSSVTDADIRTLRSEASAAGDTTMVDTCNTALSKVVGPGDVVIYDYDGNPAPAVDDVLFARAECARAIDAAAAMED